MQTKWSLSLSQPHSFFQLSLYSLWLSPILYPFTAHVFLSNYWPSCPWCLCPKMGFSKPSTGSVSGSLIAPRAQIIEAPRHGPQSNLESEDSAHEIDGPSRPRHPSFFHISDPPISRNSQTSPGSPFLSPPLSLSGYESPPYKPDLEDVMSLDMHNAFKNWKKTGYEHSNPTRLPSYVEPIAPRLHMINGVQCSTPCESSGDCPRRGSLGTFTSPSIMHVI